ncbi:MAG: NusA antitermination factor [Parcubacteria group bacterium GW2011_GWC2_38_7]|nr:MAG: NusA antitermination factor [Parcubacteria group bacterium GW2011_GWC2_38_7]
MDAQIKVIIKQICAEKGISEESVIETINSALAAAYRKDFGDKMQNVMAEFELETGETKIYDVKEVVEDLTPEELAEMERVKAEREAIREALASGELTAEELKRQREEEADKRGEEEPDEDDDEKRRFNPRTMIQLKDAKEVNKKNKLGEFVKTELEIPGSFGRMAAQTAKQVIIQRLKEAERNVIYQDYKDKEGEILTGLVQKIEGQNIIVEIDKTTGILPPNEQIRKERYRVGDRIKVYLMSVALTTRGSEIILSRKHPDIVRRLFVLEIPEIANGTIVIKDIAREAGARSKVSVSTDDSNIDPIGSCIGQRGARIQTIINELNGEKIDVIEYNENSIKYIGNALLPAKIVSVELNEEDKSATVTVPADQLSLTIGRSGQNVRLASKLTGWKLSVIEKETGKEITDEDIESGAVEKIVPTEETAEENAE